MAPYPFTPEYLQKAPERLRRRLSDIELLILCYIAAELHAADIETLERWRREGRSDSRIQDRLSELTGLARAEIRRVFRDARKAGETYYTELYKAAGKTATATQTTSEAEERMLERYTEHYGIEIVESPYRRYFRPLALVLPALASLVLSRLLVTHDLDACVAEVTESIASRGITTDAIAHTAAAAGTPTPDFTRAAERDIMHEINEISKTFADAAAGVLDTDIYEVTAHRGARDKEGPNIWCNHERWQGQLYSKAGRSGYPSIYEVCGLDEVDGLLGVNCRHGYRCFVPGLMQRMYTPEYLESLKWKEPKTYGDKQYSYYDATQVLRRAEHRARQLERQAATERASGLTDKAERHEARRLAVIEEYNKFAKQMGIETEKRGI